MTVIGITMCKDEADIIGSTVGHMLRQVDEVMAIDNGSTDGTRDILVSLGVSVIDDPEVGYYQSRRMTWLAAQAAARGATWVVPFDADELWCCPSGRVADLLAGLATPVVRAEVFDHIATALDMDDPVPVTRMGWRRREPGAMPKVACMTSVPVTIEQGNHGAFYDVNGPVPAPLVVRHFPYRSAEQFVAKARNGANAYAATDLPPDVGAHWRGYGAILATHGEEACADIFRRWFWSPDPANDPSLVFDPA